MGVLQRFERRVETLVNGAFAKAFKSEVKPVEIAAALQRESDDKAQVLSRERVMVPNAYVVELSPHDSERLEPWSDPLRSELAAMVAEHVAAQRYTPMGTVRVEFERHNDLETGIFRVRSRGDAAAPGPRLTGPRPGVVAPAPQQVAPAAAVPHATGEPYAPAAPYAPYAPYAPADLYAPEPVTQAAPEAWLEVDGARHELRQGVTVIGRGSEADLRIDDPGVSRRHAQLQMAGGHARLVDLGSTNGTLLRGERVRDVSLHDGDVLVLGRSRAVFHRAEPGVALGRARYDEQVRDAPRAMDQLDGRRATGDEGDSFVPGLR